MEPDETGHKDITDEAWDGPSPEAPPEEVTSDGQVPEDRRPVGANELRIVRRIEDSIKTSRGPRIQIIKSRDIVNARSFSEKVFRVLKMHGYRIQVLTAENLNDSVDDLNSSPVTIYTIDEDTIKQYLGSKLDELEAPMQYLFDNSMLAYNRNPVLISTVSDSFYGKVGLQRYAQPETGGVSSKKVKSGHGKKPGVSRLAIYSFYLVAFSFILSGINVLFGNLTFIRTQYSSISLLPFAILILSLAAISVRAFSLGNDDRRSVVPAAISIILFILLLLLGIVTAYYGLSITNIFSNTESVLFSGASDILLMILGAAVLLVSLSRYILFLGASSGRRAYFLSITGIILIVVVVFISNLPPVSIMGATLTNPLFGNPGGPNAMYIIINFAFSPEIPIFGAFTYFQAGGVPQYFLLRNYILFTANIIMALSFFMAIRERSSGSRSPKSV